MSASPPMHPVPVPVPAVPAAPPIIRYRYRCRLNRLRRRCIRYRYRRRLYRLRHRCIRYRYRRQPRCINSGKPKGAATSLIEAGGPNNPAPPTMRYIGSPSCAERVKLPRKSISSPSSYFFLLSMI